MTADDVTDKKLAYLQSWKIKIYSRHTLSEAFTEYKFQLYLFAINFLQQINNIFYHKDRYFLHFLQLRVVFYL